jgi:alcohol dehydrogenase YqhD (iron-dependent ADH family)
VLHQNPVRFERYARKVWGVKGAEAGIDATIAFFRDMGMPVSFSELGIGIVSDAALDTLAEGCTYGRSRTIGNFKVLDHDDIRRIYALANR